MTKNKQIGGAMAGNIEDFDAMWEGAEVLNDRWTSKSVQDLNNIMVKDTTVNVTPEIKEYMSNLKAKIDGIYKDIFDSARYKGLSSEEKTKIYIEQLNKSHYPDKLSDIQPKKYTDKTININYYGSYGKKQIKLSMSNITPFKDIILRKMMK